MSMKLPLWGKGGYSYQQTASGLAHSKKRALPFEGECDFCKRSKTLASEQARLANKYCFFQSFASVMKNTSSRKNNKLPHTVITSVHRRCTCKLGLQQVAFCLCCHKHLYAIRNSCVLFSLSRHPCFLMPKLPFGPAPLQCGLCQ